MRSSAATPADIPIDFGGGKPAPRALYEPDLLGHTSIVKSLSEISEIWARPGGRALLEHFCAIINSFSLNLLHKFQTHSSTLLVAKLVINGNMQLLPRTLRPRGQRTCRSLLLLLPFPLASATIYTKTTRTARCAPALLTAGVVAMAACSQAFSMPGGAVLCVSRPPLTCGDANRQSSRARAVVVSFAAHSQAVPASGGATLCGVPDCSSAPTAGNAPSWASVGRSATAEAIPALLAAAHGSQTREKALLFRARASST